MTKKQLLVTLSIIILLISGCSKEESKLEYRPESKEIKLETTPETWVSIVVREKLEEQLGDISLINQGKTDKNGKVSFYFQADKNKDYEVCSKIGEEELVFIINEEGELKENKNKEVDSKSSITFDIFLNDEKALSKNVSIEGISTIKDLLEEFTDKNNLEYIYSQGKIEKLGNFTKENGEFSIYKNDKKIENLNINFLRKGDNLTIEYKNNIKTVDSFIDGSNKKPYITGYSDGTFKPDKLATREEVAIIVFNILKESIKEDIQKTEKTFYDIEDTNWSKDFIATLSRLGIMSGYNDGTFRPKENITRGEIAAIFSRSLNLENKDAKNPFNDIDDYWGKSEIINIYEEGIVIGYPDGSFRPEGNITRAEIVTMVNRILGRRDKLKWNNIYKDIKEEDWYYQEIMKGSC